MSGSTRELLPASVLPLAYYACAYAGLLSGMASLTVMAGLASFSLVMRATVNSDAPGVV